jgi:hypothetical protein
MLRIQTEQLAEDRKVNVEQIRILGLQAEELKQLADDCQREAQDRRRAQAAQVNMWVTGDEDPVNVRLAAEEEPEEGPGFAHMLNTSQQPVYQVLIEWCRHRAGSTNRKSELRRGMSTCSYPQVNHQRFRWPRPLRYLPSYLP